jgi:hypothetical protein
MLVGSREAPTTATDAGRKSGRSDAVVNRRSSNSERATLASVGKTENDRWTYP